MSTAKCPAEDVTNGTASRPKLRKSAVRRSVSMMVPREACKPRLARMGNQPGSSEVLISSAVRLWIPAGMRHR